MAVWGPRWRCSKGRGTRQDILGVFRAVERPSPVLRGREAPRGMGWRVGTEYAQPHGTQ